MIKELMDSEAVGQYAAAVRISEAWYFIPAVVTSSLFPAIINARKQSEKHYHEMLQRLYDLMVWMAVAIALPLTLLANWLVQVIYGGQYDQAGSVLMIHAWTNVFAFLGAAYGKFLVIENYTTKTLYRNSLGAVINIILNYILIRKYGINGAAVATLLGQFAANYAYDFFDADLRPQLVLKTRSFFPIHILRGYH
jgi:O-antigen/teichoic acid export membrane protein